MPQREIEVILTRQLASYLTLPIFIVDPNGTLIFYNQPAEKILGHRFDETGEMAAHEWATAYQAEGGAPPTPPAELPLMVALREHRPTHGSLLILGRDGRHHAIEVTAFPLDSQSGQFLGAVAIFWEVDR
ncbi:MAG: PAS domain-containing protein [Candidatus Binatia bacterium]